MLAGPVESNKMKYPSINQMIPLGNVFDLKNRSTCLQTERTGQCVHVFVCCSLSRAVKSQASKGACSMLRHDRSSQTANAAL